MAKSDEDLDSKPKQSFSEADLHTKWNLFREQLKSEGAFNLYSIVNANQPKVQGQIILFVLPNKLMEEQFASAVKSRLVNYLRTELNNYGIQIQTKVVESEKKKYIYTPQDKFKKLAESNPSVILLKKKFGLDI